MSYTPRWEQLPSLTPSSSLIAPRTIPTISSTTVSKVIYIGDSLTAGLYAVTEPECFRDLLDVWLATLGIAAGTVVYGVGGSDSGYASTPESLAGFAAENADLAFIELGTNDASGASHAPWAPTPLPQFAANMRLISDAVRTHNPDCVMVYLTEWGQAVSEWQQYDAVIRWISDEYGGAVVNLAAVFNDNSANYLPDDVATYNGDSDGWHPNSNGHRDIARIAKVALLSGWPAGWLRRGERSNYIPNPRLVDAGGGYPSFWTNTSTGHGNRATTIVADGDAYYHQTVYTVHADDLAGAGHNVGFYIDRAIAGLFVEADPATIALEYQLVVSNARSCTGGTMDLFPQDFSAAGSVNLVPNAGWTPAATTIASLPGTTTALAWFITVPILNATAVAGDTITLRLRHPMLSKTPAAVPFFHGASTADDRWLDTDSYYARRYLATVAAPGVYSLLADTDWRTTKIETALVPVTAGRSYRASAHVEVTACAAGTYSTPSTLSAFIDWYDADGILLSSSTVGTLTSVGIQTLKATATAPAGATHALVKLRWGNDTGSPGNPTGACAATITNPALVAL